MKKKTKLRRRYKYNLYFYLKKKECQDNVARIK